MAAALTRGALGVIVEGGEGVEGLEPVLQVTDCRRIDGCGAERYRLMLSDGISQQQAMLATQLNGLVRSGALHKGSFFRMTQYICSTIQNRRIIIVVGLDVLPSETGAVGAENNYGSGSASVQNQATVPPQAFGGDQPIPAAANTPAYGSSYASGLVAAQSFKRDPSLTRGALGAIVEGGQAVEGLKPVLEVTDCRPLDKTMAECFCLMLFDGITHQQAMLATQLNGMIKFGALHNGSIIRMTQYVCNTIQNQRIIIVVGLDVLPGKNNYGSGSAAVQNQATAPPQSFGCDKPIPAAANTPAYGNSYTSGLVAGQSFKRDSSLTRGALGAIVEGGQAAEGLEPVLEVTDCRPLDRCPAERYRLMLSDGITSQQAMLAGQLNGMVKSGALHNGSVIRMTQYGCSTIQNRRIIIVVGLDVLSGEIDAVGVGNNYGSGFAAVQNQATVPPQSFGGAQPIPTDGDVFSGPDIYTARTSPDNDTDLVQRFSRNLFI